MKSGSRIIPRKRETVLKWDGWGYKDTQFKLNSEGFVSTINKKNNLVSVHNCFSISVQ